MNDTEKLKLLEAYRDTCKLLDERWKALADPETGELDMSYYFNDQPLKELIRLKNSIVLRLKTEFNYIPSREILPKSKGIDKSIENSPPNQSNRESADIDRAMGGYK